MKLEDVNLQLGYVVCRGNQKERIIPIGNTCRDLLAEYIENGRYNFVRNRTETALFTNCQGHEMSRQGFWKILKGYAASAGIELCFRRGDHGRHNTSYSEAFFRGTYDPERRRREKRSGDDGTFGYFIHPDVSGRKSCKNAGCIYEIPPEILDDEREYSRNGNSADTPSFVISTFRRWYTEASQILPSPGRRL